MTPMSFSALARARLSRETRRGFIRSTGCPSWETFRMDIKSGKTRLITLFTVRAFESSTPDVDHFGNDGGGDFSRQQGANIKSDRHVYTLEPVSRDAFSFELIRDRTNFPLAADHPDISRIRLNRPAQYVLILLMSARDDDDVG